MNAILKFLTKVFISTKREELNQVRDKFESQYPRGSKIRYLDEIWTIIRPVALWIPDGIGWVAWLECERINPIGQHETIKIQNFSLVQSA